MIEAGDALNIAGGVFSGGTAIMLLRWAVNLFFVRLDKREDKLDLKGDKLLDALVARVEALTASEKELGDRLTATEKALHDCLMKHIESERAVADLQAKVEQLSALPTNERELP